MGRCRRCTTRRCCRDRAAGRCVKGGAGTTVRRAQFRMRFYGGARDVAVMARNVRDIEIFEKGVDPDAYETKRVNEMIFSRRR